MPSSDDELAEAAGAVGQAAVTGVSRAAGMFTGARLGLAAGAAISATFPPAAPVVLPTTAFIGLLGGYFAGDWFQDGLSEFGLAKDPRNMPEWLKPLGYFGEALGSGAAMTGGVMALANMAGRLPSSMVGRLVNGILNTARDKPVQFLAAEVPAITQSAAAEGLYAAANPDDPGGRMLVGIAAGVVSPVRLAARAASKSYDSLHRLVQSWFTSGRQTRAAELLQAWAKASREAPAGFDPADLMQWFAKTKEVADSIPGWKGTVAQTMGDARMAQLEAAVGSPTACSGPRYSSRRTTR